MDGNAELSAFADRLEKATIDTIESGEMTKDLALITTIENPTVLNSEDFIKAVAKRLYFPYKRHPAGRILKFQDTASRAFSSEVKITDRSSFYPDTYSGLIPHTWNG